VYDTFYAVTKYREDNGTDDKNDSGMVTVVTNLVSNDNSIQIPHFVW
jgi:hypothetical protein